LNGAASALPLAPRIVLLATKLFATWIVLYAVDKVLNGFWSWSARLQRLQRDDMIQFTSRKSAAVCHATHLNFNSPFQDCRHQNLSSIYLIGHCYSFYSKYILPPLKIHRLCPYTIIVAAPLDLRVGAPKCYLSTSLIFFNTIAA